MNRLESPGFSRGEDVKERRSADGTFTGVSFTQMEGTNRKTLRRRTAMATVRRLALMRRDDSNRAARELVSCGVSGVRW